MIKGQNEHGDLKDEEEDIDYGEAVLVISQSDYDRLLHDIDSQELLINGLQKENEKLYSSIRGHENDNSRSAREDEQRAEPSSQLTWHIRFLFCCCCWWWWGIGAFLCCYWLLVLDRLLTVTAGRLMTFAQS